MFGLLDWMRRYILCLCSDVSTDIFPLLFLVVTLFIWSEHSLSHTLSTRCCCALFLCSYFMRAYLVIVITGASLAQCSNFWRFISGCYGSLSHKVFICNSNNIECPFTTILFHVAYDYCSQSWTSFSQN